MRRQNQKGQALLLIIVALGIFMIGALGLAVDGAQLYTHRQMAQAAADAAAQAGIMSVFNGTSSTAPHNFPTSTFTCGTTDQKTPCLYAANNGFGSTASDVITVDFPGSAAAPGVTLWVDPLNPTAVNTLRVTVQRTLSTGLIRFVGSTSATIKTVAIAAIVDVLAPVPIIVLHPTLSSAFEKHGTNDIKICGGPSRSIQVNSNSTTSVGVSGNSGTVDLSNAGPDTTPGLCDGTGADFGDQGGPAAFPGTLLLGTKPGRYSQPAAIIQDPLLSVAAPTASGTAGSYVVYPAGAHGCPAALPAAAECRVYSPGFYNTGIALGQSNKVFALFRPGIYYINHGGFHLLSNSIARMAVAPDDSDPVTATGWSEGMVVYNSPQTPVNTTNDVFEIAANAGQIQNVMYPDANCAGGGNCLVGSPILSSYKNILFFQNRSTATTLQHSLQGGGGLQIRGTIYLTHTAAGIVSDGTYQALTLQGTSGSATEITGEIVVDTLSLGGTSQVKMTLNPNSLLHVRQIALIK